MKINSIQYKTHIIRIISYPFLGLHPNILTLFSLLSSVFFFFFLSNLMYGLALVSLFGAVFDAIDGYVARHTGKTSSFGGFFDSVCDRISDFLIIAAFGYARLVAWEVVAPAILTTFLVSYLRARSEVAQQKGKKMDSGFFQRTGRFVVIAGGLVMYLLLPEAVGILAGMLLVLILLNSVTIVQRIYAAYRLLE